MLTLLAVSIPFTEMGQPLSTGDWNFTCELQVEYASEENASMVYTTLSVDKEVSHDYGLQLYSPKLILFVLLYN